VPDGARTFIAIAAAVPLALATAEALWRGGAVLPVPAPHLTILAGILLVLLAPDRLTIPRHRLAGWLLAIGLLLPPLVWLAAVPALPWLFAFPSAHQIDARTLGAAGHDLFARRTGKPLAYVIGEGEAARALALAANDRPHFLSFERLESLGAADRAAIESAGALIVWSRRPGEVPDQASVIAADLTPETPLDVPWRIAGRLPQQRLGLAVLRPRAVPEPPARP
jgi:hypothetical protein